MPALAWRLDKHRARLASETPHLTRSPSATIREHVWLTTQPMEEPEQRRHLADTIRWIGLERLLFATDYPHWDYDDPDWSLPVRLDEAQRASLFRGNAMALYGIG